MGKAKKRPAGGAAPVGPKVNRASRNPVAKKSKRKAPDQKQPWKLSWLRVHPDGKEERFREKPNHFRTLEVWDTGNFEVTRTWCWYETVAKNAPPILRQVPPLGKGWKHVRTVHRPPPKRETDPKSYSIWNRAVVRKGGA